jgi:Xaa-Pro aminopeptidase
MSRRTRLYAALTSAGFDGWIATQRPNQLYFTPVEEPVSDLPPVPFVLFHPADTVVIPGQAFYYACRDHITACTVARTEVGGIDPFDALAEAINTHAIRRLAVDHLAPTLQQQLHARLPHVEWVETPLLGPELRRAKEPVELEIMRHVAQISDLGMAAAFGAARPGATNRDIAAAATHAMLQAGCEDVGVQVATGPGSAYMGTGNWTYQPWRTLAEGDMVLVDMGILYKGYLGDQTRTAILGTGTQPQRDIIELVQEAYHRTVEAMQPGARTDELYQISVELFKQRELEQYFPHHISHGLGLGNDLPRINAGATGILQVGDTLSCEPGLYVPGVGGARFENMLLITPSGAESLTHSPANPLVGATS